MNVATLMQGTINGGKAKPRLDSDLFEGVFSHAGLTTAEDNQSFIIIPANNWGSTETRSSKYDWSAERKCGIGDRNNSLYKPETQRYAQTTYLIAPLPVLVKSDPGSDDTLLTIYWQGHSAGLDNSRASLKLDDL
ncbi:hypothetical protein K6R05_18780 (plasmid) [Pantoea alfalfae]|uniref:hypothetical protein n=1 Tax=Pantoea alfalfae TaxID=3074822 RepID=UPI001CA45ADA|nr:hypothetical protein [Pantoea alfalfae]QZX97740.1 hypothetical protein K6R05_18780 [Pantoea alfalfae]